MQAGFLFGLAPDGVCRATDVTTRSGGLLPHRFTLTELPQRFAFCCTFPNLTVGRRYRPSCSTEPGLSSLKSKRLHPLPQGTPNRPHLRNGCNRLIMTRRQNHQTGNENTALSNEKTPIAKKGATSTTKRCHAFE